MLTTKQQIKVLIKELDAQRAEINKLAHQPEEVIKAKFHEHVTVPLKSLTARADYMEVTQRRLI